MRPYGVGLYGRRKYKTEGVSLKTISVFGLGKLGCCMVGCFADAGHKVVGVDVNSGFVDMVDSGEPSVDEPGLDSLIRRNKKNISATMDTMSAVMDSDVSFIIVPTPSLRSGEFFTSIAQRAAEGIGKALKKKRGYHLVVLTSTVLPGASRRDIIAVLEKYSGKKCGKGFGFCYSPEFIAIGNVIKGLVNPDFFLIGEYDKKSGDALERVYRRVHRASGQKTVGSGRSAVDRGQRTVDGEQKTASQRKGAGPRFVRMSIENAELTKIAVNTFVTNKISFANTIGRICSKLPGGDAFAVTEAIGADARVGSKYLKPGSAFGGPCFPRDNRAFAWFANSIGENAPLAKATDEVNWSQIDHLVEMIIAANPKARKIGLLGLSYKDSTNLMEESQAVAIATSLIGRGYEVSAYDPEVARQGATVEVRGLRIEDSGQLIEAREKKRKNSMDSLVAKNPVVVIATNHAEFKKLKSSMFEGKRKVLVDLWGMHLAKWREKKWYIVPGVARG